LVFTAFLLDVQHLIGFVWRQAGKFAFCVLEQELNGIACTFEWLDWLVAGDSLTRRPQRSVCCLLVEVSRQNKWVPKPEIVTVFIFAVQAVVSICSRFIWSRFRDYFKYAKLGLLMSHTLSGNSNEIKKRNRRCNR